LGNVLHVFTHDRRYQPRDYVRISRALMARPVAWDIYKTITFFISGVLTGLIELAYHFSKVTEFIIPAKAVIVEAIWTGYATGNVTVGVNITNVPNPYVLVCVSSDISGSSMPGCTLNSVTVPLIVGATATRDSGIFGMIPTTLGAQNVVVTLATYDQRVSVYLLSGVDQVSPIINSATVFATASSLTTAAMAASLHGLIVDTANFTSGTVSAADGQTVTAVNSKNHSGTRIPSATSVTSTWATTVSSAGRLCAVSMKPVT